MFQRGRDLLAIEVRTGRRKDVLPCLADLAEAFAPKRALVVGRSGVPLDELLSRPVLHALARLTRETVSAEATASRETGRVGQGRSPW